MAWLRQLRLTGRRIVLRRLTVENGNTTCWGRTYTPSPDEVPGAVIELCGESAKASSEAENQNQTVRGFSRPPDRHRLV